MNIETLIAQQISLCFEQVFGQNIAADTIKLTPNKTEYEGDVTFVVFPFVKLTKKNPEETAKIIGDFLVEKTGVVAKYSVVKGFLNLVIHSATWVQVLAEMLANENFGKKAPNGKKVMVEYSSPNTNKPLHLGHLRNNFLGFAVSNILAANGYEVIKANLVNDRGIHICKSMLAYQKWGNGETPQSANLKGDHLIGKYYVLFEQENKKQVEVLVSKFKAENPTADDEALLKFKENAKMQTALIAEAQTMLEQWEKGDKATVALWKQMNDWVYEGFNATYKAIGVSFDKFYYESNTYLLGKDVIEEGLQKGVFYQKPDKSVWIDLTAEGLDHKLVLRANGTSVYITQDIGTADLKYKDFGMEKSIYVIGNEQDYHMKVLKLIMQRLGRPYADGMYHLSYGMVELPTGKMKSREGTVVDADDLVAELINLAKEKTAELGKVQELPETEKENLYHTLGTGAIKYFLLKVDPRKTMLFNPEESLDLQGDTATYIQYTHARLAAILRRATALSETHAVAAFKDFSDVNPEEKELIQLLTAFPQKIQSAADEYSPALIASYAYEIARAYGKFYHFHPIFDASNAAQKAFRIALSAVTVRTLKTAANLLGIEMPERM